MRGSESLVAAVVGVVALWSVTVVRAAPALESWFTGGRSVVGGATSCVTSHEAGEVTTNSIGMKLRWIPPGSFTMGSPFGEEGRYDEEGPQHHVRLTTGFWLAQTEVTQAQWRAVMGKVQSLLRGDDLPVVFVSWDECWAGTRSALYTGPLTILEKEQRAGAGRHRLVPRKQRHGGAVPLSLGRMAREAVSTQASRAAPGGAEASELVGPP